MIEDDIMKVNEVAGINERNVTTAFFRNREKAWELLHTISVQLKQLEQRQQLKPEDWGYVGSLEHVVEELQGISAFLGPAK